MSKLDNILLKLGNDVLDLPKTNDPLGKPFDDGKQAIKELMLELIDESISGKGTYEELIYPEYVREKVEAL